jgi:6-phosphogluconolactonase (cycloisomerase 2 family)
LNRLTRNLARICLVSAVVSIGVGGAAVSTASAATPRHGSPPGWRSQGAVFVQTDNPSGNQVIAYQRTSTGALVNPQTYETGGDGAIAAGSAVDPLASQGSLVLANGGRTLLAVNAGSDSISVFQVFGSNLYLSQVVSSGGEFPSSIAVHGNLVYVLNTGGAGAVQGFFLFGGWLWSLPESNRSLGLSNTNPPFFLDAPGQVGFTPDGRHLIVTTKESGNDIDVYSVGWFGYLSWEPTVNVAVAPIPFAFTFDSAGNLLVTEAGASDLTAYSIASNGTVTAVGSAGDGQAALCWVTAADGYFYGSNAGSANVSEFDETVPGDLNLVGIAASVNAGATDSAVSSDGRYLYVEEGGAGTVFEFQIGPGGALTSVGSLSGLSAPMEGIAAS